MQGIFTEEDALELKFPEELTAQYHARAPFGTHRDLDDIPPSLAVALSKEMRRWKITKRRRRSAGPLWGEIS
jgi:hypothetical protein